MISLTVLPAVSAASIEVPNTFSKTELIIDLKNNVIDQIKKFVGCLKIEALAQYFFVYGGSFYFNVFIRSLGL